MRDARAAFQSVGSCLVGLENAGVLSATNHREAIEPHQTCYPGGVHAPLWRLALTLLLIGCGGQAVDKVSSREPSTKQVDAAAPDASRVTGEGSAGDARPLPAGSEPSQAPVSWWESGDTPTSKPRWLLFPKPQTNGYPSALLVRFDDVTDPSQTALGGHWLRGALWSPNGERLIYQLDDVDLGIATMGGGLSLWIVDVADGATPKQLDAELGLHYVEAMRWLGNDAVFIEFRDSNQTSTRAGYYRLDVPTLTVERLNDAPASRNSQGATIPWFAASERGVVFPSGCIFRFLGNDSAVPVFLPRSTCGARPKWARDARYFSLTNAEGTWLYELTDDGPRELELPELVAADLDGASADDSPVALEEPSFTWAPSGARFASVWRPTDESLASRLLLGDAETGELVDHADVRRTGYARWLSERILYVETPDYMSSRIFDLPNIAAKIDLETEYAGFRKLGDEFRESRVASNAKVTNDGRSLLFATTPAGIYELGELDDPPKRLTPDLAPRRLGGFSISPDDEWVIFDSSVPDGLYVRNLLRRDAVGEFLSFDEHPGWEGTHVKWAEFTSDGEGILCDAQRILPDGSVHALVIYVPLGAPADAYVLVDLPGDNGSQLFQVPDAWPSR